MRYQHKFNCASEEWVFFSDTRFDIKFWRLGPALHFSWIPQVLLSRQEMHKVSFFIGLYRRVMLMFWMLLIFSKWKIYLIILAFLDYRLLVLIGWIFLAKWCIYESVNLINGLASIILIFSKTLDFLPIFPYSFIRWYRKIILINSNMYFEIGNGRCRLYLLLFMKAFYFFFISFDSQRRSVWNIYPQIVCIVKSRFF